MRIRRAIRPVIVLVTMMAQIPLHADPKATSLQSLIELGLNNSLDQLAAGAEIKFQEKNESLLARGQFLPQISVTASHQIYKFDSTYVSRDGTRINGDGSEPTFGAIVSYNLQNLLNANDAVARKSVDFAKVQARVIARDLTRNIKKGYYAISELNQEIVEIEKLINLYTQVDLILRKQAKLGVYLEIERKQFQVQRSILTSELETRKANREVAYAQLSLIMNVDVDALRSAIDGIEGIPTLRFADRTELSVENAAHLDDHQMLKALSAPYGLAKAEVDAFSSTVLPTVYLRGTRQLPTMPSSNGFQTVGEFGVSFPIDAAFTRSAQKSQLIAKAEKAQLLYRRAVVDYHNQIRLTAMNLIRYQNLNEPLNATRKDTTALLDKSFLFYSQRRLDVMGTLDVFQKYLQAARASLINTLQVQNLDADLEYLVGAADHVDI